MNLKDGGEIHSLTLSCCVPGTVETGHVMSMTLTKLADCLLIQSGFSGKEVNKRLFNLDKVPVADQGMIPPNLSQ